MLTSRQNKAKQRKNKRCNAYTQLKRDTPSDDKDVLP